MNRYDPAKGEFFRKMPGSGPLVPQQASVFEQGVDGPNYLFGSLKTYEHPITEFPGDILIPVNAAGSVTTLTSGLQLPTNCVGVRFVSLTPNVLISVNGGGQRVCLNGDVISGCRINSLIIYTDGAGTCIVQSVGTGD